MSRRKRSNWVSHLCDALAIAVACGVTIYTVLAITDVWGIAAGAGAVVAYLLVALFFVVIPNINTTLRLTALIMRALQSDEAEADSETSPQHLMSGVRGKTARPKMGFHPNPVIAVEPPAPVEPASSPTVA